MMGAEEIVGDNSDSASATDPSEEKFRSRAALLVAILAMLLALAGLGGDNAAEEIVNNNIQANDLFAWYQAKNIRQTIYELAVADLEILLAVSEGDLPATAQAQIQQRLAEYRATIQRYESEPDPADPENPLRGEGKRELLAQARFYTDQRDRALLRDPNFDYAETFFQIAIVVASVAILTTSRAVLILAIALGSVALIFLINGYFLIATLPF